MKSNTSKIFLFHGENDYLVYKALKDKKKELDEKKIEYKEFWGSDDIKFNQLYELLNSAPIFFDQSVILLRNITEGTSLYDFVNDLQEYLTSKKEFSNELYIFNQGKVAKTTKIYKAIDKFGEIKEFTNPKEDEVRDVIKKSISISNDACEELLLRTQGNLFLVRNEIKKLNTLISKDKKEISLKDIEDLSIKLKNQNDVWGVGKQFINSLIREYDNQKNGNNLNNPAKLQLIKEIESNLLEGTEPMMILYSFYNYVISFIKLKKLSAQGKGFKEAMSIGYYFAKEFFSQKDKLDLQILQKVNSQLLDYEYKVKSGEIDDVQGLRQLILNIR